MTTIPLTDQEIAEDFLVLNLQNVGFSDEQFVELCRDNDELLFELTAGKEPMIMTPPGPDQRALATRTKRANREEYGWNSGSDCR